MVHFGLGSRVEERRHMEEGGLVMLRLDFIVRDAAAHMMVVILEQMHQVPEYLKID